MKFFWNLARKSIGLQKPRILTLSAISRFESTALEALPQNLKELSVLPSPFRAQGLVISQDIVHDFWLSNNLDKKIKKIITPLSLHHPRALAMAAQAIQRLITRQNIPESWQESWQTALKTIQKNPIKPANISVYFENKEIGCADWLPEFRSQSSPGELFKIIKQSLAAIYSERFIRERLQRGWSHHHLPLTLVVNFLDDVKVKTDFSLVIHTTHPRYHNSAIAQILVTTKGELHDYTIFKPAFISKKSLILNHWQNPVLSEEVMRALLAPVFALEAKTKQSVSLSGWYHDKTAFTVLRLDLVPRENSGEVLYEYTLSRTSPVLVTGEFFGQGIAVGSLCVERLGLQPKIIHSGNIIVAKKLATISQAMVAEAVGFILEEDLDTAQIAAKTRQITVPILAGVKNAVKKFRSGAIVTLAPTSAKQGALYSGALPYEVKPIVRVKHKIKTEVRPTQTRVTIDELIVRSGASHPFTYFSQNKFEKNIYTQLLGQALAQEIAEQYPARLTIVFSNSLPRVFTQWCGGKSAENKLRLRASARGAERYLSKTYQPVLAAECDAIKEVRDRFGFTELDIQLPYCRSVGELEEMMELLSKHGLTRESGWRFSLATDMPGHAILTAALAKHLDELVFDIDSLVKSTTGTRSAITTATQKTVEQALSAIAKAAHKEGTRIALSGTLLATEPRLIWSAVKSGVKTLMVSPEEESAVRTATWEAERSVGYGNTSPQFLGTMASLACLGALLITVGAGCGRQAPAVSAPQMTPAQIRAEIVSALADEREKSLAENTTATVYGFANFKVAHPRAYETTMAPTEFVLTNQSTNEVLRFSAFTQFGTASSTDFLTTTNLPGKLFMVVPEQTKDEIIFTEVMPTYIYEIELAKNKILKIESPTSSIAIMNIAKSIQVLLNTN